MRHTLDTAIDRICGPDSGLADPRLWVLRRLRRGTFTGIKIGRQWQMTDQDIEAAIQTCRRGLPPTPEPAPAAEPPSIVDGLSPRSRNRLRSA